MFTQDTDDNLSSLRNRRRSSVFTTSSGEWVWQSNRCSQGNIWQVTNTAEGGGSAGYSLEILKILILTNGILCTIVKRFWISSFTHFLCITSTAISVEDAVQEQILQNIKLHKEVLSSVKQQPWNMRRKLRLVRQAQAYIRRHEGELQERLAQGRTTRDVLARFNIVINKVMCVLGLRGLE